MKLLTLLLLLSSPLYALDLKNTDSLDSCWKQCNTRQEYLTCLDYYGNDFTPIEFKETVNEIDPLIEHERDSFLNCLEEATNEKESVKCLNEYRNILSDMEREEFLGEIDVLYNKESTK